MYNISCVVSLLFFFFTFVMCMLKSNVFLFVQRLYEQHVFIFFVVFFYFFFGIVYTIFCVLLLFFVMHNTQVLVFGVVIVELRKTLSSERSGPTKIYDYYKIWNWNTHIEVIKYYLNVLKFMLLYLQWHIHGKWGI